MEYLTKIKYFYRNRAAIENAYGSIIYQLLNANISMIKLKESNFKINIEDDASLYIIDEIFFQEVYKTNLFDIEKNDLIIDIGANIGVFSLYASQFTNNDIFAFEPVSSSFKILQKNVSQNGVKNIKPVNKGVTKKSGINKIKTVSESGGHSMYFDNIDDNYEKVVTTKLEEVITKNNIDQIGVLKMDCEGCEGDVIDSLDIDHLKIIRKIVMEFHDNVSCLDNEEIRQKLEKSGFHCETLKTKNSPFGYIFAYRS